MAAGFMAAGVYDDAFVRLLLSSSYQEATLLNSNLWK